MQAMFYTPEASNSPTRTGFSEKHPIGSDHDEVGESNIERLSSPPQTAVSA
jgi:hypothetical protein